VRTQHPVQLEVLHLDPIGAEPPKQGEALTRADLAYSSLWIGGGVLGGDALQMDGELLRVGYKGRIGITDTIELGGELAFGYAGGGFLDSFLIDYHEALGLPDQGRSESPRDDYKVAVTNDGQTAYSMKPYDIEPFDVPLSLAWHILPCTKNRPFGIGVRGGIELPLGDPNRGFGNGVIDKALGVFGEARFGMLSLTAFAQHTFVRTPDRARQAGLAYRDVDAAGLGAEYLLSDGVAALLQVEAESSTLRDLDFDVASNPQLQLWMGGRVRMSEDVAFEFAIGEDLSSHTSPDVTGYVAFAFGLSRARGR
jgi:hypothetical protein